MLVWRDIVYILSLYVTTMLLGGAIDVVRVIAVVLLRSDGLNFGRSRPHVAGPTRVLENSGSVISFAENGTFATLTAKWFLFIALLSGGDMSIERRKHRRSYRGHVTLIFFLRQV